MQINPIKPTSFWKITEFNGKIPRKRREKQVRLSRDKGGRLIVLETAAPGEILQPTIVSPLLASIGTEHRIFLQRREPDATTLTTAEPSSQTGGFAGHAVPRHTHAASGSRLAATVRLRGTHHRGNVRLARTAPLPLLMHPATARLTAIPGPRHACGELRPACPAFAEEPRQT